jgi:N-acetylneuraminic acid mutarotase
MNQLKFRFLLDTLKRLVPPSRYRPVGTIVFIAILLGTGVGGSQAGTVSPSNFSFTGGLATARDGHIATLLPSGKVLVAGGSDGQTPLVTAELYDPATGLWTATGNVVAPFVLATATLLQNGNVLVVGGGASVVQLYDPATGSWSVTGNLHQARRFHTATLLPNGKVLVAGGSAGGTSSGSAEIYDPANGTWAITGNMGTFRMNHTATLLPNGTVLVAGGSHFTPPPGSVSEDLSSCEVYNPAKESWTGTGSLQSPRDSQTATLLPNGQVLVAGGSYVNSLGTAELYNPTTKTWDTTGNLTAERVNHTATLLPSGKVLVAGGSAFASQATHFGAIAELFDPATGTWSLGTEMRRARAAHTATLLPNGQVLVAAGDFGPPLSSVEIYDPTTLSAPQQLQNIATRLNVLADDKVLIGGFIIAGSVPKKVMLRGTGPSLPFAGSLADPTLELHLANGSMVTNDNWKIDDQTGQSQEAAIRATTIPPSNDLEAALVRTLDPGNYTAILRGKNNGQGIGLVEVYDLDANAPAELANISTRGFVDKGDNVMIGGVILGPEGLGRGEIIVRAIGPSLNVAGTLADPTLEVRNSQGDKLASNDNWKIDDSTGQSQQTKIASTTLAPYNDFESAVVIMLSPGSYTAIVAGKSGSTGIGLVEVYNLH